MTQLFEDLNAPMPNTPDFSAQTIKGNRLKNFKKNRGSATHQRRLAQTAQAGRLEMPARGL
jgi:hypothetical protein